MKTYVKKHTNKKAAAAHVEKIKKRGGQVTVFNEDGKYTIAYSFPDKKGKAKKKKLHDVLSPDGKTIRIHTPLFDSLKASKEYFDKWKLNYARQGYWSPKHGLIPMAKLKIYCKWIKV
ncbi:MAG: hypothetical protein JST26_05625 [Bacteroidetes bacterium]|nr:hypothetical protein [Bacteroidota bacterium]